MYKVVLTEHAKQRLMDGAYGEAVKQFLECVKGHPSKMQDLMRRHGYVIDNLDDPWQKLAFTLYTEIVELSSQARDLLESLESMEEGEMV